MSVKNKEKKMVNDNEWVPTTNLFTDSELVISQTPDSAILISFDDKISPSLVHCHITNIHQIQKKKKLTTRHQQKQQ